MLTTLNGMFAQPKPHRINFIKENKKKLKKISSMVNQNSKSRFDLTKWKNSQTEISHTESGSLTGLKSKNTTSSTCRLNGKGSMAVFVQDKKDRGNSSVSLKQKSSQRVVTQKNQCCQTIDPRRCDQLFHEGVIKYPSNKVLQELAEIEKQKANRLDAHIRKEFFRRNKLKAKSPAKITCPKVSTILSGKGDEKEKNISEYEEEEEDVTETAEPPEETQQIPKEVKKPSPPLTMCAAEIIRRTTEELSSPRGCPQLDHVPNSKGDARVNKKPPKKPSKDDIVLDPQCPPGHIPLPDVERKKTLHMLRVSHAELVREMNLLPVRTDTLRVRQKKIQLENQLNKIEEGIKVFVKSKVYVKIEE